MNNKSCFQSFSQSKCTCAVPPQRQLFSKPFSWFHFIAEGLKSGDPVFPNKEKIPNRTVCQNFDFVLTCSLIDKLVTCHMIL